MPELTVIITARRILEDLARTNVDPVAVMHVRNGLSAIADAISRLEDADGLIRRSDVLVLVDPTAELGS